MTNDIRPIIAAFEKQGITIISNDVIDEQTRPPCITYRESGNSETHVGDTIGWSNLRYIIEIWERDYGTLLQKCTKSDKAMRSLGYRRTNATEQTMNNITRKVLTYERYKSECYKEE